MGMLLGKTEFEFLTFFANLAERARRLGVIRKMSTYTNEFLRAWLPDGGDEYLYLNNRLYVCVTRFPYGNEIISNWTSNRDLRNTMNATMCIPFYTNAEVLNVNGRYVADGALTMDTFDIVPGATIKVTIDLTNTTANIMGYGFTPMDILFPNPDHRVEAIFDLGKEMGRNWKQWEQVEQGFITNFAKHTLNLTARVYIANLARFARLLEMALGEIGILHFEPLIVEQERKAKWSESSDGRYMRRQSMSMGGGVV